MPTEPELAPPDRVGEFSPAARLLLCAVFLFLADLLCQVIGDVLLRSSGFYAWFYGAEQVEQAHELANEGLPVRMSLWLYAVTFPLWLLGVVLFFRMTRLVPPAKVGLTPRHAARNLAWGVVAALVLIPPVMGLNLAVTWYFQTVLHLPIKEHPFSFIGQHGMLPVEWVLLAFAVIVSAPLREELMFRGVLQRLFAEYPWGSHVAMGMAFVLAFARSPLDRETFTSGIQATVSASMPVLFVLAMVPV